MRQKSPVIVLGAGIAGLAAAHTLTQAGVPVVLIEAKSVVGGRIQTVQLENGDYLGLGPLFLHGRGSENQPNPLYSLLKKCLVNMKTVDFHDTHLVFGSEKIESQAKHNAIFQAFDHTVQLLSEHIDASYRPVNYSATPDCTVAEIFDALEASMKIQPDPLLDSQGRLFARAYETAECAAPLDRIGPLEWILHNNPYSGEDLLLMDRGYAQLVDSLLEESLKTGLLDLQLESVVTRVIHQKNEVGCEFTRGGTQYKRLSADIICALPVGVLKSGLVSFEPALSAEKTRALSCIEAGSMTTAILEFTDVFWEDKPFIGMVDPKQSGILSLFVNHHQLSDSRVPALGAFIMSGFNYGNICEDDLLKLLSDVYSKEAVRTHFKRASLHHWGQDPFCLGAWCCYGPTLKEADIAHLKSREGTHLYFAGEHTGFSTVESAYLSGIRAAQNILII